MDPQIRIDEIIISVDQNKTGSKFRVLKFSFMELVSDKTTS